MAVKVRIPTPLQGLTGGQKEVEGVSGTVTDLIKDLDQRFPGISERISDGGKKIRRFVNIYVNEEDIRFLKAEETEIKDGDEISIVPAIAGGEEKEEMMNKRVRLTFPQHLIKEPAIFTMARKYDVMPNIRRARVTETVGEMILELRGTEDNLTKGIQSLRDQGINVELIEGDIIE
jgi:molybdopterin converting factor small subunit